MSEEDNNAKKEETKTETEKTTTETKSETDLEKENSKLKQQIATLETKLSETQSLKAELNTRLAALEIESKKAKINKVLAPKIPDEKLRREKIRLYIGKGLSTQDVEEHLPDIPLPTLRKAKLESTTSNEGRASLGSNNTNETLEDKQKALESLQLLEGGFA